MRFYAAGISIKKQLNTRSEYPSIWRTRYRFKVVVWTSGLLEAIENMNTVFKYRSNPFSRRERELTGRQLEQSDLVLGTLI